MTRSYSAKIEGLLQSIEPKHRRKKLRTSIDIYFQDARRRDKRGRKTTELAKVITTLRHVLNMHSWASRERYDLNIRRRIKKMLKHIDHHQSWERTRIDASKARGLANQAGKTWNDRREYGPNEVIILDHEYVVYRLNTVGEMRSVGKRAGNCLVSFSYYFDQLRNREAQFYELRKSGDTCACFSVDCYSFRVLEIETYGRHDEDVELPPHVIWRMCKRLGISGDSEELFLKNGIFEIFLEGLANPTLPMLTAQDFQIWWREGEIVIKDVRTGRWSLLFWSRSKWRRSMFSQFNTHSLEVMSRFYPEFNQILQTAEPVSSES